MVDKVCPWCGGRLRAIVSVIYTHAIDRKTGRLAKRGKRLGDEINSVNCETCGAYQTKPGEGFFRPDPRNPDPNADMSD